MGEFWSRRRRGILAALAVVATGACVTPAAASAAPLPVPWGPAGAVAGAPRPSSAPGTNDFSCKPAPGTRPVVLVHGLGGSLGTNWATMAPLLKNNGFCVFGLTYGAKPGLPLLGGLTRMEDSSAELASFVDRVLQSTGAEKVDLVGHSEGTVMPRWYLSFRGGAAKVDKFVQLTPIWNGTNLAGLSDLADLTARLGIPGRQLGELLVGPLCGSCAELLRGSDYLKKVNDAGPTVPGITYTGIVTKYDELVIPYTSGVLDAPNVTNITLQDVCPEDRSEHIAIAFSPNAGQLVLNALAPDRARKVRCVPFSPSGVSGPQPEVGLDPAPSPAGTNDRGGTVRPTGSAARCQAPRRLTIRVRPTNRAIRTAVVRVGAQRVATRRAPGTRATRGRKVATVDLRRRAGRTVVVRTTATLKARDRRGRLVRVTDVRRYRVCAAS